MTEDPFGPTGGPVAGRPAGSDEAAGRPSAFGSFFASRSVLVDLRLDNIVTLSDPATVVLVEAGAIDLFAARVAGGAPVGRWTPLCRLQAGAVLSLGAPAGPRHAVIGRPVPGSMISTMRMAQLGALCGRAAPDPGDDEAGDPADPIDALQAATEFVHGVDQALTALERALRQGLPPREFIALEESTEVTVRAGDVVRSVAGVLWVQVLSGAVVSGRAGAAATHATGDRLSMTELDWLTAETDCRLRVRPTGALLACGELGAALTLHAFRFAYGVDRAVERREQQEQHAIDLLIEQNLTSDRRTEQSFARLLGQSAGPCDDDGGEPSSRAADCLLTVAARANIDLPEPAAGAAPQHAEDRLVIEQFAASAGIATRTVRLVGQWWTHDSGPLIGYLRQRGRCVALLPDKRGYLLSDADRGKPIRMDATSATRLRVEATMLYRALPRNVDGVRSLLRFGMAGSGREARRFLLVAAAVAAIGLLVPVLTGAILGSWVPTGQRSLVVQGAVLIMLSAVAVAALSVVQNTAVLRLEGRLDLTMQAAVWARLLALPMSFFARYAAAELGTVALGISAIRETISSVSTVAALGLVTGMLNLILLFFYSLPLAVIAVGMVSVSIVVSALLARRGIRFQRILYRSEQQLASRTYQFLSGLSALRLAAAEGRAFAQWSKVLADNVASSLKVRRAQAAVTVFNAGFTVLCSLAIFAVVGGPMRGAVGITAFLAFFTAFNQLLGSLLQFCNGAVAALAVVPMIEEMVPILSSQPEVREGMAPPGDLDGSIEVRGVSFRYGADGPLVLDEVSFDIGPGEFVALVGGTGSGKSTILRLLLGFEQPTDGSILFDGQDMRRLDIGALRRQCGVVLQNGSLLAGDIATNILAGTTYSIEDAWRAAELAGIADDIRAMPMGMHTVIPDGGSTLSGGQRQRLMIARALLSAPRMLFFDEATSALDNETQRVVTESTRRLNASRLVIAHRLSTIEHADRIVVLDAGRVVQVGTYSDLVADADGVFARLVHRQLVDVAGA